MDGSPVCPQCGQTFAEFQTSSLLGCAGCYLAFAEDLAPVFKRLHGVARHCQEKTPASGELAKLKTQLQDAVAREAYEEASDIRDRILTLKQITP
ncbi:MAG: hypothetical protein HOE48_12515 [Candidatus Latescibacteria bacterium]|jgi:protein arginine kinase activator|nr:hypothetical protein [Candidatus Latescibacterota bacterium]MBT4138736.1 hypothetical protein [Candidatus Latescibacterota bacterium]